jgi:hypothetical protein
MCARWSCLVVFVCCYPSPLWLLTVLPLLLTASCYCCCWLLLFATTANDPNNFAQRMDSWMGKILRIRLSTAPGATGYTIPGDNMSGEIWAYGFRYVHRCTVTVYTLVPDHNSYLLIASILLLRSNALHVDDVTVTAQNCYKHCK